jgi:hypothetical protein
MYKGMFIALFNKTEKDYWYRRSSGADKEAGDGRTGHGRKTELILQDCCK